MRTLQDYLEIYRGIAKNLNLKGDSIEMLSQMLANATYISEVENISYAQEASLERATLINSKIQHCMNEMYSVVRGNNPRVILKFTSTKYFTLNIFDELCSSNSFKVYYLGYLGNSGENVIGTSAISGENNFIYSPITIPPGQTCTLIGLISSNVIDKNWTLSDSNTYYVDLLENDLSNDLYVKINNTFYDTTRQFSDHILDAKIFDLTLPSFGLRLYSPDIFRAEFNKIETETPANTLISTRVFKYCLLDSFNTSELSQLKVKGGTLENFTTEFLVGGNYSSLSTGLIYLSEIPRDTVTTVHYRANRDRYVNSILRSNSDIGTVLEEMYPSKVRQGGTSYRFDSIKTSKETIINTKNIFSLGSSSTDTKPRYLDQVSGLYVYTNSLVTDSIFNYTDNLNFSQKLLLLSTGKFLNGKPSESILRIPINKKSGTLEIIHQSTSSTLDTSTPIYDIIPSISVLSKVSDELIQKSVYIYIMKTVDSSSTILTTSKEIRNEGLFIKYNIDSGEDTYITSGNNLITLTNDITEKLTVSLSKSGINLEESEIIPVLTNNTTVSTSFSGNLILNLANDVIYVESDVDGKVTTPLPLSTTVGLYLSGVKITTGILYEIINPKGFEGSIDQTGIIKIIKISEEVQNIAVPIRVTYNDISLVTILTIRKTNSIYSDSYRSLIISDDITGQKILSKHNSSISGITTSIFYDNTNEEDYLYIWSENKGINLYQIVWTSQESTISNTISENYKTVPKLNLYYIPYSISDLLTDSEITNFKNKRGAYYVTNDINVLRGKSIRAIFTIKAILYENTSIDSKIEEILGTYSYKFNISLPDRIKEITALLNKISNVKNITDLTIKYISELGDVITWSDISGDLDTTYFNITYNVNSIIS